MSGAGLPAFVLEGGIALALARGLSVAALLCVFGSLLFRTAIAPAVLARMGRGDAARFERRWRVLFWSSWGAVILATIGWLVLQAAAIAGAPNVLAGASALPSVLADTRFGHLVLLRLAMLALAALVLGRGPARLWAATGLAGVALALQAGHSHAASMDDG